MRRHLAQDTGTDPFENLMGPWDGSEEIAEDFTWATAPTLGNAHHVRPRFFRRTKR